MDYMHGGYANAAPQWGSDAKISAQQLGARAPEIPHLMQEMAKAMEVMGHALDDLETRLASITRAAAPTPEPANQLSAAPSTPHGAALKLHVAQASEYGVRIQSLMQRLEI